MADITERLAEIEARVEAATEGPWEVDQGGEDALPCVISEIVAALEEGDR